MDTTDHSPPRLPPRWFIRSFWAGHRTLYRVTGGRLGLSRPKPGKYGMLRLHTIGRRTGKERAVILAYYKDGADLVILAMNGWGDPPPAWWPNLLAHPDATVDLVDGERAVHAREARARSGSDSGPGSASTRRVPTWTRWRSCAHGIPPSSSSSRRPSADPAILVPLTRRRSPDPTRATNVAGARLA